MPCPEQIQAAMPAMRDWMAAEYGWYWLDAPEEELLAEFDRPGGVEQFIADHPEEGQHG